ncbi:MAG: DNA mismatch repair endonuclease MutL [Bacteroides sp.]|nr:DNA mismatch repair endonuclease MutL [Bacteroides sp.]
MSDIIRLLPDSVANQIAAGEVIQRPASVIKELVENAIDAGATHIDVLVVDAGKTSIQVIDDGKGMSETDARLSFERHATSKIREAADLFALHTMGFRGEALASIAAVAQVELRTRMEGEELGTLLTIAGSKVESQEAVSCPKGSSFSVKNLFFNVPARRKFLKSNQTELSNILTEFERIVLVNPDVSFTLHHNGSELFNLPALQLRQRIMGVFGKKINQELLSLDVDTTMVRVSGFVGKPESARKKGARQYFFVNGRYMRHPYFHKAIMDAYEQLVPVGEQVSYFIYLEVDPGNIDVNIHPTKTEIKFENEQAIWQILAAAVKETLGKFNAVPSIDFDTEGMPDIPAFDASPYAGIQPPKTTYNPEYNPFNTSAAPPSSYSKPSRDWEQLYSGLEQHVSSQVSHPDESDYMMNMTPATENPGLYDHVEDAGVSEKSTQHYQFKGRFILTSVKSGLMIIDQQRAHVRILYDKYLDQITRRQGVSQGMLFPDIVQFPLSEVAILQEIMEDLSFLGFELTDLGGGSYAINGIPAGIEGLNPIELIQNMVHTAMEKGGKVKEEVQSILALTLAKAAAIVPGQVLTNEEMTSLVDGLFAVTTPNYTPDGKTVLSVINEDDLEKLFK